MVSGMDNRIAKAKRRVSCYPREKYTYLKERLLEADHVPSTSVTARKTRTGQESSVIPVVMTRAVREEMGQIAYGLDPLIAQSNRRRRVGTLVLRWRYPPGCH